MVKSSFVTWIYDDMCLALARALLERISLESVPAQLGEIELNMITMTTGILRNILLGALKRITKHTFNNVGDLFRDYM